MAHFKRMQPLLGTFVEIGVSEHGKSEHSKKAESAVSAAFATIAKLHQLLSFHEANSDLTQLNEVKFIEANHHALRVIKLAKAMTIASNGLFNCTLGGALVQHKVLPNHSNMATQSSGVATDIQICGNQIRLNNNVKITLDGIAKGYAVDCAIATLKRHGIATGWVNAGGDLRVYGDLVLPIQRREADGEMIALGGLQNAAMATSVVTEYDDAAFPGKIMSDLTAPHSGTWSVMAHYAWRADALTKVAAIAHDDERKAIVNRLGGVLL